MFPFLKKHAPVIVAVCLVAPADRAFSTVRLDDFDSASDSNAVVIVSEAIGLADPARGDQDERETAQTALASPLIEIEEWSGSLFDTTLVDVDSLDFKVMGVSLMDGFFRSKVR